LTGALESTDPAEVKDVAGLAACMRALLDRRGLSYSTLAKAAARLPQRNGEMPSLPRSTVSDMLSGKRLPTRSRLVTFLAACRVSPDDLPHWLAAWDRARVAGPVPAPRIPPEARRPAPAARLPSRRPRLFALVAGTAIIAAGATAAGLWFSGALSRSQPHPGGLTLVVTASNWTHSSPDPFDPSHVGNLEAGPHQFYCWTLGTQMHLNGYTSSTWVKTYDEHDNAVYINSLWLYAGDTRNLPRC
jgi:hypothetical protein